MLGDWLMLCGHDWRMLGFQVTRFYASTKFTGEKVGYVFKMGASGVGYYLDAPPKVSLSLTQTHTH